MAIKIIKFDLPINGSKVTTLEALRDNLTDEIVPLARSGQLERWFNSRQLQEQAQAVAAAVSQHTEDKALFMALCAVLEVEVHPDDASAIFDAPPEVQRNIREIERSIVQYYKSLIKDISDIYKDSDLKYDEMWLRMSSSVDSAIKFKPKNKPNFLEYTESLYQDNINLRQLAIDLLKEASEYRTSLEADKIKIFRKIGDTFEKLLFNSSPKKN